MKAISSEYQHRQDLDGFQKSLHPCALDKNSLSIGRVNIALNIPNECIHKAWVLILGP